MEPSRIKERFEKAYRELSEQIFRYCYFKLSDRERAKEIAQDSFMRTWDYLVNGNEIKNMRAFVYKVANNLIVNEYERKKRASSLEAMYEEAGFEPSTASEDEEALRNRIDGERLLQKLKELEPDYRDVIFLRYVDEFSVKEIAELTGDTENNISVRIHRGLKKLKKIYDHE